jgi:hypothetical protein
MVSGIVGIQIIADRGYVNVRWAETTPDEPNEED